MCEKCNRLVAAIQYEINIIEGVLRKVDTGSEDNGASGTSVFIAYEAIYFTLKNIIDSLNNGKGT